MSPIKSKLDEIISGCENTNNLYEDPEFPASNCSLSLYKTLPIGNIVWLRTRDILEKRNDLKVDFYFLNKDSQISVKSGKFGSSELVGALAIASQRADLLDIIFDQKQIEGEHANISKCQKYGIFSFKLWFNGVWQEIVIDDRLPTDGSGQLIFISSNNGGNLLPSLLEKAYAKLLGSYDAISSCTLSEILHHLTGGVVESFDLYRCPPSSPFLINSIFRTLESQSIIGCSINLSNKNTGRGVVLCNGLLTCHQYVIVDIREIKLVSQKNELPVILVKLKNPWGKMKSWKGSWNPKSPEWSKLTKDDIDCMGLHLNNSAEFWMDFNEFLRLFDTFDLCTIPSSSSSLPPSSPSDVKSFEWNCQTFQGKWKMGSSAGGRPTCKESHWTNPQYRLTLKESDNITIVELEQKSIVHNEEKKEIGFVIYKFHKGSSFPLNKDYFDGNTFVAHCDFFANLKFVVKRFILEHGVYVIIPSTFHANVEGSFVLRVVTSSVINSVEPSDNFSDSTPRPSISSHRLDSFKDPKEEAIEKHFFDLASDDQQITLQQMRSILNKELKSENQAKEFSLELCKHLVSLIDKSCKNRINLREMLYLWNVAKSWKKSFGTFDRSKQGTVNSHELRSLILSMGYKFTPTVLNQLTYKYSNEHHSIELESFLTCMIRILNLHDTFKNREKNEKLVCTLDEWLELSLSIL